SRHRSRRQLLPHLPPVGEARSGRALLSTNARVPRAQGRARSRRAISERVVPPLSRDVSGRAVGRLRGQVSRAPALAPWLWLFTVLLSGRVAGQLLVWTRAPGWLPPMAQWQSGLLPYPVLLAGQAVVLWLMVWIALDFSRDAGVFVQPLPRLGAAALWWSLL